MGKIILECGGRPEGECVCSPEQGGRVISEQKDNLLTERETELESDGNEAEAMAEESNALGEFEQKDKYSISTIVDVGNDAYKTGVKAERQRIREAVKGAGLTDAESADVYRQMWHEGWDEPLPCMKLRRAIAERMRQAILKAIGMEEK